MRLDDTDLPWVMTSPNCPTLDTALCYIGTCIFEGTNCSEGRGTTMPFQLIGAPFIRAGELEKRLSELDTPGIHFRRASFVPTFSKHAGQTCHGVQMHILDRDRADVHAVQVEQQFGDAAFGVAGIGRNGPAGQFRQVEPDLQHRAEQGIDAQGVAERGLFLQRHDPVQRLAAGPAVRLGQRQQIAVFLHVAREVLHQERRLGRGRGLPEAVAHGLHQHGGPAAGFRGAEHVGFSGRDQQEVADFHALAPLADGLDAAAFAAVEPFIFVGMHVLAATRNVALERVQIHVKHVGHDADFSDSGRCFFHRAGHFSIGGV